MALIDWVSANWATGECTLADLVELGVEDDMDTLMASTEGGGMLYGTVGVTDSELSTGVQ